MFQGRTKGFDVIKALSATSVRDFEGAISMVSYGFEEIENFYAKSSCREMVGKVKIPLLFIQVCCVLLCSLVADLNECLYQIAFSMIFNS